MPAGPLLPDPVTLRMTLAEPRQLGGRLRIAEGGGWLITCWRPAPGGAFVSRPPTLCVPPLSQLNAHPQQSNCVSLVSILMNTIKPAAKQGDFFPCHVWAVH